MISVDGLNLDAVSPCAHHRGDVPPFGAWRSGDAGIGGATAGASNARV
jgi:hypothetical protein